MAYREFLDFSGIQEFFDECRKQCILGRSDWTCCNTCGEYEIVMEKDEAEKLDIEEGYVEEADNHKYIAYVFYHDQIADDIKKQLADDSCKDIQVYLNWGYFNKEDWKNDPDGKELAKKIIECAAKATGSATKPNLKIDDYTNINKKLLLHFPINQ